MIWGAQHDDYEDRIPLLPRRNSAEIERLAGRLDILTNTKSGRAKNFGRKVIYKKSMKWFRLSHLTEWPDASRAKQIEGTLITRKSLPTPIAGMPNTTACRSMMPGYSRDAPLMRDVIIDRERSARTVLPGSCDIWRYENKKEKSISFSWFTNKGWRANCKSYILPHIVDDAWRSGSVLFQKCRCRRDACFVTLHFSPR